MDFATTQRSPPPLSESTKTNEYNKMIHSLKVRPLPLIYSFIHLPHQLSGMTISRCLIGRCPTFNRQDTNNRLLLHYSQAFAVHLPTLIISLPFQPKAVNVSLVRLHCQGPTDLQLTKANFTHHFKKIILPNAQIILRFQKINLFSENVSQP